MKFTIGIKIFVGYALAFLAIIALAITAYVTVRHLEENFREVQSERAFIAQLDAFHDFIAAAQEGQRVFLLTGTQGTLGKLDLDATLAEITPKIQALRVAPAATGRDVEITTIATLSKDLLGKLKAETEDRTKADLGKTVERSMSVMDQLVVAIEHLKSLETAEFEAVDKEVGTLAVQLERIVMFGSLLALIVVGVVGFLVVRNITVALSRIEAVARRMAVGDFTGSLDDAGRGDEIGSLARSFAAMITALLRIEAVAGRMAEGDFTVSLRDPVRGEEMGSLSRSFGAMIAALANLITQVQRSGLQVNSSAIEIAATTKEQQTTAGEVATTSAEISATAKEMSATSSELLKTADNVSTVAEQASSLASGGKDGLVRMEKIMRGILDASASITAKLGVMNEKAGNINAVVSTIGKVADQTNLLSLNAAIEAEKAGEYGRGFAVVATEIRRLADQTAASTGDIELMVKEMVSAVSAGVMGMDKFAEELRRGAAEIASVGTQLDRVISEVQSLAPSVESVSDGMRSQTQGALQISEALAQLGEAARLTADSIRDSSRAVDQLNEATSGLQSGIARFKLPS